MNNIIKQGSDLFADYSGEQQGIVCTEKAKRKEEIDNKREPCESFKPKVKICFNCRFHTVSDVVLASMGMYEKHLHICCKKINVETNFVTGTMNKTVVFCEDGNPDGCCNIFKEKINT